MAAQGQRDGGLRNAGFRGNVFLSDSFLLHSPGPFWE